ncbi:MAG: putative SnoaL-like aldol condensation-catalyzing enzyme, partial [Myxococcota bacterium]
MVDGPTQATDIDRTEANRALVRAFVETVFIAGDLDALDTFVSTDHYTEHHPTGTDGVEALRARLAAAASGPGAVACHTLHRVLAQGRFFVLAVIEGSRGGVHDAFYHLYRVEAGELVEHWD